MSAGAIFKPTARRAGESPRILLRGHSEPTPQAAAEIGSWITERELQALKQSCIERGMAEGLARGRSIAEEALRTPIEREAAARFQQELKRQTERLARQDAEHWRSLASAWSTQFDALRERLESELTEWTFAVVVRLLGAASVQDVRAAIQKVLEEAGVQGPLRVLLHRTDLERLRACNALDPVRWPADIQFAADDRVSLGGCLVESEFQTLDARLEVQLAYLRQALDASRSRAGDREV